MDEVSTAISKSFKFPAFERISKVLSMVLEKFQPDKLDKQSEYLLLYMVSDIAVPCADVLSYCFSRERCRCQFLRLECKCIRIYISLECSL